MRSHLELISSITVAFQRSSGCCVCRLKGCVCRRRQAAPYGYWNFQQCRRAGVLLRLLYYLVCARNEMMGMEPLAFQRGYGFYSTTLVGKYTQTYRSSAQRCSLHETRSCTFMIVRTRAGHVSVSAVRL